MKRLYDWLEREAERTKVLQVQLAMIAAASVGLFLVGLARLHWVFWLAEGEAGS